MASLHTEALVLRAVDFAESDRIVHLLTPESGRLTAIAKGARRSVKRFPGTLDLFNHLAVQVEQRRPSSMARLEHARLLRAFQGLRTSAGRFALGCYLLELLDRLAPEGAAPPDARLLFRHALEALALIDEEPPSPRLRALLELRLLDALGLRPELARCVRCGRALTADGDGRVAFRVADGGAACARCRAEASDGLPVHLGTLRSLESSLRFPLARVGRIALGGAALAEARALLGRFLRFHLGVELRSERFLDEQLTPRDPEGKLRPSRSTGPA